MIRTMPAQGSSSLPVTRNMPYTSISVPIRSRQSTRNMTGIYLGLEGNLKPPRPHTTIIPPLSRGRGMPSTRIRTPTEERRLKNNQKLIELLRIKEEKKGFVGQPLKRKPKEDCNTNNNCTSANKENSFSRKTSASPKQWGPGAKLIPNESYEHIRTNARNFTTVKNNGFNRLENLQGWLSFDNDEQANVVTEELHRLTMNREDFIGIDECYRKVCNSNLESLSTVLPHHKSNSQLRQEEALYTGFSVRSYRKPNQAAILATFPDISSRPKTVPILRPNVPGPYFFRVNTQFQQPKRTSSESPRASKTVHLQFEDQANYFNGPQRFHAAPGTGGVSRHLNYLMKLDEANAKTNSIKPDESNTDVTRAESPNKDINEDETHAAYSSRLVPTPTTDVALDKQEPAESSDYSSVTSTPRKMNNSAEDTATMLNRINGMENMTDDELNQSAAPVVIGLEDEDGESVEVEIDVTEEENQAPVVPRGKLRKSSIADKVSRTRASEAKVASLKENAEQRQKEFEQLLTEHAELVQEISRSASSESIQGERDH